MKTKEEKTAQTAQNTRNYHHVTQIHESTWNILSHNTSFYFTMLSPDLATATKSYELDLQGTKNRQLL